jgi:muconolactone delta-isomerase
MKCLFTSHTKDSYYALPQETRMQLMEGSMAFVDRYRKEGKCKEIYFTPDMKGSVSVWEMESDVEVAHLMLEFPQLPYTDFEITPILEWDAGLKALAEYREQMAAAPPPQRVAA